MHRDELVETNFFNYRDVDDLYYGLACEIQEVITESVNRAGTCNISLGREGVSESLFFILMTDPEFRSIPWSNVVLWILDEKETGSSDIKTWPWVYDLLLKPSGIMKDQVHRINTDILNPLQFLENKLTHHFDTSKKSFYFDYVLLGEIENNWVGPLNIENIDSAKNALLSCKNGVNLYTLSWKLVLNAKHISIIKIHDCQDKHIDNFLLKIQGLSCDPNLRFHVKR